MISKGEAPFACGTGGVCFATCAVLLRGARFAGTARRAVLPAGALTVEAAIAIVTLAVRVYASEEYDATAVFSRLRKKCSFEMNPPCLALPRHIHHTP